MARLVWTAEAIADLEAIRDYIARTSPRYGTPDSGAAYSYGAFRLVYRYRREQDAAEVLTVFRASRRFPDFGTR